MSMFCGGSRHPAYAPQGMSCIRISFTLSKSDKAKGTGVASLTSRNAKSPSSGIRQSTGKPRDTNAEDRDHAVEAEQWYGYYVKAVNAAGESTASGTDLINTKPETVGVPEQPASLDAAEDVTGEVTLSWSAPGNGPAPTGYSVYREEISVGNTDGMVLIGTTGADTTSYTDDSVEGETWYSYYVRATNDAGESGLEGPESILTGVQTEGVPGQPDGATAEQ